MSGHGTAYDQSCYTAFFYDVDSITSIPRTKRTRLFGRRIQSKFFIGTHLPGRENFLRGLCLRTFVHTTALEGTSTRSTVKDNSTRNMSYVSTNPLLEDHYPLVRLGRYGQLLESLMTNDDNRAVFTIVIEEICT